MTVPKEVIAAIEAHQVFLAHCHVSPDADSVGATLALQMGLAQIGKTVEVYCEDPLPELTSFLKGAGSVKLLKLTDAICIDHDAYLCVDTASWKLGTRLIPIPPINEYLINIDHHPDNDIKANVNWVDADASAASEMVYHLLLALEVKITQEIADCLLMGILLDTGIFQNSNTTAEVLEMASDLRRLTPNYPLCILNLAGSLPYSTVLIWSILLKNMKLSEDGDFAWTTISQDEWLENKGDMRIGDFANRFLGRIKGTSFGAVLTEKESGVTKGSFRSRLDYDVSELAHLLSGGGHKSSAAIKLELPLAQAEERFLNAVKQLKSKTAKP